MKVTLLFCAWFLAATSASADEVWIIGGLAATRTGACSGVRWQGETILHNRGASDAAVRLLHVSNGGAVNVDAATAVLPGGQSYPARLLGVAGTANATLWVSRLELPPSVAVESRLDYYAADLCAPAGHPPEILPAGKIRLPVFRRLVPPGEEQAYYGTDLGRQTIRSNVAIYNAADVSAVAEVTLHRPLCPSVAETRRLVGIPPDTILQIPLGSSDPCLQSPFGWSSFVTVVVDQPSVSFVSTLANGADVAVTATVTAEER